ncbi:hypothetical protein C0J52_01856 [Blattella germanica]|nr:hypothetical protein C0J52_01856 [Blattella germanica]
MYRQPPPNEKTNVYIGETAMVTLLPSMAPWLQPKHGTMYHTCEQYDFFSPRLNAASVLDLGPTLEIPMTAEITSSSTPFKNPAINSYCYHKL